MTTVHAPPQSAAEVRERLEEALRLNLVGPGADGPLAAEELPGWVRPSELVRHRVPGPARGAAGTAGGRRRRGRLRGRGPRPIRARGGIGRGFEGGEAGVLPVVHRAELPGRPRDGDAHCDGALGRLREGRSRRGAGSRRKAVSGLAADATERIRAAPARRLDGNADGGRSRLGRAAAARRRTVPDGGNARGRDSGGNARRIGLPRERTPRSEGREADRDGRRVPGGDQSVVRWRIPRAPGPARLPSERLGRGGRRPSLRRCARVRDRARCLRRLGDRRRRGLPHGAHDLGPTGRGREN